MTNVTYTHSFTNSVTGSSAIWTFFTFARRIVRRFNERRALNYLLSMPDYQLKDVGLQRGDIQREAIKPLWRI